VLMLLGLCFEIARHFLQVASC